MLGRGDSMLNEIIDIDARKPSRDCFHIDIGLPNGFSSSMSVAIVPSEFGETRKEYQDGRNDVRNKAQQKGKHDKRECHRDPKHSQCDTKRQAGEDSDNRFYC